MSLFLDAVKIAVMTVLFCASSSVQAGSLDPANPPGPTMHTLEDIYQRIDGIAAPQSISATTAVIQTGYYMATNLALVDTDLLAGNISTSVVIFGIVGSLDTNRFFAAMADTGQTNSYQTGDDGAYKAGATWPHPRFSIQIDTNCVLDNLTGLVWARNANLAGAVTWSNAVVFCENLNYGGHTDWRLPNRNELASLTDIRNYNPVLCNISGEGVWMANNPFTGVQQTGYYWSGSTCSFNTTYAWWLYMYDGVVNFSAKTMGLYVWPVRGGL